MHVIERLQDITEHGAQPLLRNLTGSRGRLVQHITLDMFHYVISGAERGEGFRYLYDIGVIELGQQLSLFQKSLQRPVEYLFLFARAGRCHGQ